MCLKPACFGYGHHDDDHHYSPVGDAPLGFSPATTSQRAGYGYGHGQQQGHRHGMAIHHDTGHGATTTSVARQAAAYTYPLAPHGTSAAARNYGHGEGHHGARCSEMGRY